MAELTDRVSLSDSIEGDMATENKLAYKDMSNLAYILGTVVLYSLTVFGSCLIKNPGDLFDWIGAVNAPAS